MLSDHYEEYFHHYESIYGAGATISSEQSGEMLHSRLQKMWNLRFKTREINQELYSKRLMVNITTILIGMMLFVNHKKELSNLGNTMATHNEAELMENLHQLR